MHQDNKTLTIIKINQVKQLRPWHGKSTSHDRSSMPELSLNSIQGWGNSLRAKLDFRNEKAFPLGFRWDLNEMGPITHVILGMERPSEDPGTLLCRAGASWPLGFISFSQKDKIRLNSLLKTYLPFTDYCSVYLWQVMSQEKQHTVKCQEMIVSQSLESMMKFLSARWADATLNTLYHYHQQNRSLGQ